MECSVEGMTEFAGCDCDCKKGEFPQWLQEMVDDGTVTPGEARAGLARSIRLLREHDYDEKD